MNGNLFWDENGYPMLAVVACDPEFNSELLNEINEMVKDRLTKAGLKFNGVSRESLAVTGA